LAGLAGSLYKFAFDLRLLQSPVIGEWGEPFGSHQVGSSAMPFKRNPINAEKLDSLGRLIASLVEVAWNNHAHSLLERTLDDSANRREILPIAFLAADEMLKVAQRILANLRIDDEAASRNFERYGVFAAIERILMQAAKEGADRQQLHEHLREQSMAAWQAISQGKANPLADLLTNSEILTAYLAPEKIRALLDASTYVGDAPERARQFAQLILDHLKENHNAPRTPERL
jgi:adenylosuccinate lyase